MGVEKRKQVTTEGAIRQKSPLRRAPRAAVELGRALDFDHVGVRGLHDGDLLAAALGQAHGAAERQVALEELEQRFGWEEASSLLVKAGPAGQRLAERTWGAWMSRGLPTLSAPGDLHEREADAAASAALSGRGAAPALTPAAPAQDGPNPLRERIAARRGAGSPLPAAARADFEARFGASFEDVRIHTDAAAAKLSDEVGAQAFTAGRDVFFGAGRFELGSAPGRELIAHELAHTLQQRGMSAAEAPLQRKVVLGAQKRVGVLTKDDEKIEDPGHIGIDEKLAAKGEGDREVAKMVADGPTRYFKDQAELEGYAAGQTQDIGYVDREKTWVRLPAGPLVLGEAHSETTLKDLVAATGQPNYQYEGEKPPASPYLAGQDAAAVKTSGRGSSDEHSIEAALPIYVVGLVGIRGDIEKAVAAARDQIRGRFFGTSSSKKADWKGQLKADADKALAAGPGPDAYAQYEQDLAAWSAKWEKDQGDAKQRSAAHHGSPDTNTTIYDAPPDRPYKREKAEISAALKALKGLQGAKRPGGDAVMKFYASHKEIVDTTVVQLDGGVPLDKTRMFQKMVTGKFDLDALINALKAAANAEFRATGIEDIGDHKDHGQTYETDAAGQDMEKLRDSYMLENMVDGAKNGVRLFGVGDNHRKNLQKLLNARIPDVVVKAAGVFYTEQYKDHPDKG